MFKHPIRTALFTPTNSVKMYVFNAEADSVIVRLLESGIVAFSEIEINRRGSDTVLSIVQPTRELMENLRNEIHAILGL